MATSKIPINYASNKTVTKSIPTVSANDIVTMTIDISSNPSVTENLKSFVISSSANLVPLILQVHKNTIDVRLRNVANSAQTGASITIIYA